MRSIACGFVVAAPLLLGSACEETPSFRARWSICETVDGCGDGAEPHAPPLTAAAQCSFAGIGGVQITTTDAAGFIADEREHSCFPRSFRDLHGAIEGPELPSGDYDVEIRGLRRHRKLTKPDADGNVASIDDWSDELGEPLVLDQRSVTVTAGETLDLIDYELPPPPQCDDGIDNDRDGFTDLFDPACSFGLENIDITTTQFRMEVELLGGNPNARCSGVGISRFRFRLDDGSELHGPIGCPMSGLGAETPILFSANLPAGDYIGHVDGINNQLAAVTTVEVFPFSVRAGGGGLVEIRAGFDGSDFLEPIVASANFSLGYRSHPQSVIRFCETNTGISNLAIDQVALRVVGAHGVELDQPVMRNDGTPLDGAPLPCSSKATITEPLEWGEYLMYVDALSAEGDVCFSSGAQPIPLAPGGTAPASIVLSRPEGPVAASCADCVDDDDCDGDCVDSVCVPAQ